MRLSLPTLLAYAVVAAASVFAGQIPLGDRTVGAHVVRRTKDLIGWVGKETSQSSARVTDGLKRGVSQAEKLTGPAEKPGPYSDDDLVSESDRRSLMRLLE